MTALTIRLPESLHQEVRQFAKAEGISINQFMAFAAAEKISFLRSVDFLRVEAALGSREDFDAVMAAIPDIEPDREDQL